MDLFLERACGYGHFYTCDALYLVGATSSINGMAPVTSSYLPLDETSDIRYESLRGRDVARKSIYVLSTSPTGWPSRTSTQCRSCPPTKRLFMYDRHVPRNLFEQVLAAKDGVSPIDYLLEREQASHKLTRTCHICDWSHRNLPRNARHC